MTEINKLMSYYGALVVKSEDGKFYLSIPNHCSDCWREIPEYLYDALLRYHNELTTPSTPNHTS